MMKKNIEIFISQAEEHFSLIDPILFQLISRHGRCDLFDKNYNPYGTLIRSIISQQLSAKAANTIENRVLESVKHINPLRMLEISEDELRETGLSRAKIRYIKELSNRVIDGRLNFDNFENYSDDEVITLLTEVPGIGKWTAEMFLIFGLGRPDILSLGDAGLKRAVILLYGETFTLETTGEKWRSHLQRLDYGS